jgi:cytochrome c5
MKMELVLATAGAMVLTPGLAAASQPAQPANQSSTEAQTPAKAQTPSTKKDSGHVDASCDTTGKAMGKSANAKADHDPSATPGKDTGWVPPPSKNSGSKADTGCAAQSH